jgi:diguanylate cyclase (GGDEF)-like protein
VPSTTQSDHPLTWDASLYFVKVAIVALLMGSASFLIYVSVFSAGQLPRIIGNAVAMLLALSAWILMARGQIKAAVTLLAYGSWTVITGIAFVNGGVRAPAIIVYPMIILMAGWLISSRTAQILAVLSVTASCGFLLADLSGTLPKPPPTFSGMYALLQVTIFALSGTLITFLVRTYSEHLKQSRTVASELTQRTVDLQRSQSELHQAQAAAKVGSWIYDVVEDLMQMSDETCRIFGVAIGSHGSREDYLARVHPNDHDSIANAWDEALKGTPFDHEHRIVIGETVRWVRQKADFQFSEDGIPVLAAGIAQDITERKHSEEQIQKLAYFDPLTDLPNRTLLRDRLKQGVTASSRLQSHGAVLFIDLDRFKTLNDTQGHAKGDLLLQQVAHRLSSCIRAGDTVARIGGDEFVVVLGNLSGSPREAASEAELIGKKILASLERTYQLGDINHLCTASIGVTLFCNPEASVDDLLRQADLAMYRAKAGGRSQMRFFDLAMEIAVVDRAAMENDLRAALASTQFLLHYQPQVTAAKQITGAEVLIRWQHPTRGLVSPAEFIPLAEDTGLILPIGEWVLRTACHQLALWADQEKMAHLTISVNVSALQFRQPDFVEQVVATINSSGVNPQRLKLELTESLLVTDVEETITKMLALKSLGIGFSLDDFGTGYSSLSYLKRMPLEQLKIDMSFVRDVLTDPNDAVIAKTIIALGKSLGLGVIAEGVETAEQQDFLAAAGCHAYQGYLFSRPLILDKF